MTSTANSISLPTSEYNGHVPTARIAHAVVAVSTVIFSLLGRDNGEHGLHLPLVRRTREPYVGRWALPGGWISGDETLTDAAARTLAETTSLRPHYLEQLYTLAQPTRVRHHTETTPTERVISVIYSALVRQHEAKQSRDTMTDENVDWFSIDQLPELAFDHGDIIEYAIWRLRNKVEYAHVAFYFLGDTFTLGQLRAVYECILERRLDPANFRRRVEATGAIVPTNKHVTGGRHRPPRLYRTSFLPDQIVSGPTT